MAAAGRLARSPRARAAIAAGALPVAALLALSPGGLATAAARAGLAAAAIGAAAALVRRGARPATAPILSVTARATVGDGAGLAVVEADGRRMLVGYGRAGVSLVAELRPVAPEAGP